MQRRFIVVALAVRILIALATQTFFQPDEYFQSLEVAHNLVFGYGKLTWEWLAPKPVRSIFYPALNIPIYWILETLDLDETRLLIWGPKVLHGTFAAGTDIWLCKLAESVVGARYVSTAFFLSLTSLFHGLSLSRSISNSLETTLTTIALSYFPWDLSIFSSRKDIRMSLVFAALACAVRPTNAVIWVYMFTVLLWHLWPQKTKLLGVFLELLIIGTVAVLVLTCLDSLYYGKVTFTPLNFILTNLSSVSLFYGSSPWHYYLSQAVPILCTTSFPFVLHGAWLVSKESWMMAPKQMLGLVLWTTGIYSLTGHKEWRFIHPLLPLMHILAAKSLVDVYYSKTKTFLRSSQQSRLSQNLPIRKSHMSVIICSLPAMLYVVLFHERAQIEVMHYLRHISPNPKSIGFLMPCHSTPWQSYLHKPSLADVGYLWALGCEPPLAGEYISEYMDQTDIFYRSPRIYLETRFPDIVNMTFPPSPHPCSRPGERSNGDKAWQHEWPEYLVFFGALLQEEGFQGTIEAKGYRQVWHKEYGWEGDWRRRGGVRVWKHWSDLVAL